MKDPIVQDYVNFIKHATFQPKQKQATDLNLGTKSPERDNTILEKIQEMESKNEDHAVVVQERISKIEKQIDFESKKNLFLRLISHNLLWLKKQKLPKIRLLTSRMH